MIEHVINLNEITQEVEVVEVTRVSVGILTADIGTIGVSSVNGLTGVVTLSLDSINEGTLYKRFPASEYLDLTDGGETNLHTHPGGSSNDEKVKYDVNDTLAGYLGAKTVGGTGITLSEGTGGDADKLLITNSLPDQTVVLTAGTNMTSITGTYPNLTINAATQTTDITSKLSLDQTTSQSIINGQPVQDTLTPSELVATDANKKLSSLPVLSYPSLTEISYIKGLTGAIQTQLDGKVDENVAIVAGTKTKITYDAKGLVTSGTDATTADIAESTNKKYITDAEEIILGNTSNTNTGDETQSTIKTKLGAATASVDGYATATQITKLDGIEAGAEVTDAINVGTSINGVTDKTTPIDNDKIGYIDSEASNVLKKFTFTNLKAFLKTYFDNLYNLYVLPTAAAATLGGIKIGTGLSIDGNGVVTASGGGASYWTDLTGAYASTATFTFTGTAVQAAQITFSLFTCLDTAGTTRRYGYVKSASESSGTVTVTVVSDSNLAANDKDFKIAYSRKIFDYQNLISLPFELVADSSNPVGLRLLNVKSASKLMPVDFNLITAAVHSGTGVVTVNLYSDTTALFSSAPDLVETASLIEQRPTTRDISAGVDISLRVTAITADTTKPYWLQCLFFLVPDTEFVGAT